LCELGRQRKRRESLRALVFQKKALQILDLAIEQGVEIAIADEIVEETIRVSS
jgi:hypothetical protein